MSAASALPIRGMWRRPMATSGTASGSPASRWRGGNQKPNIVGATNAATTSWAPSAAAQSAAASSISRTPGTACASRSRCECHSHQSAGEGQHEHRRPAQQPVLAVEEEGHQAVAALEVAAG